MPDNRPVAYHENILSRCNLDDSILVDVYKHSAKISFPNNSDHEPPEEPPERATTIQSAKSRRNAGFKLGNAETDWLAMVTLTYRVGPKEYETLKRHRKLFLDNVRAKFGKFDYGWILEFTKAGRPHFHVFLGSAGDLGKAIAESPDRKVKRHGKTRTVLTGELDSCFVRWWSRIVGDTTEGFRKFQNGGIIERFETPDGAGRYVAKEATKRYQKHAPFPVSAWWYLARGIGPKTRSVRRITVKEYLRWRQDGRMISTVWDVSAIQDHFESK
jgi:hypothetical protein